MDSDVSEIETLYDAIEAQSAALVAEVKINNPLAWQRLVRTYAPLIYAWCRRARLGPEDAADVMQDVFQAVWCGIGRFDGAQSGTTFRG